jgi:hypothetical protein
MIETGGSMRRIVVGILVVLAASGCSKGNGTTAGARPSSDLLTQKEISTVSVSNAYDAVQRLRPTFLRPRSTATRTMEYAIVFLDGIRSGGPETLKTIPAGQIKEIRYLNARDATTRYGLNVSAGVLEVRLLGR